MSDHTADPRWQEQQAIWLQERRPDESPTDRLLRGAMASFQKFLIETEYEAASWGESA